MKVEISKEQKLVLGEKINLCVDFLKKQIQPHLVVKDCIVIPMGDILDLYISQKEIFVIKTQVISLGVDFFLKKKLFLEKPGRKKAKKYICEACPELAVDFLKHWEEAKLELMSQVNDKNKKINDFNNFVDGFRL